MIKNSIKIVFWDLDETLWNGTLAEGDEVSLISERIIIIRELNQRGIVNSICSKNDYLKAKERLEAFGVWDLFVFSSIAYRPKGKMIESALDKMHLRAENALFIDDLQTNLNEVEYYNKGISTLLADECACVLENKYMQGKDDKSLSRLNQYRQLEKKEQAREKMNGDNEDFLRSCHIVLSLIPYSDDKLERVYELSERTNQLNYTKNRMSKNELNELMTKTDVEAKLCQVVDDFGNYGIAGFYALRNGELIHYVFSCRIMNMGIEKALFKYLNYPKLEVVGEVATALEYSGDFDWVKIVNIEKRKNEFSTMCKITDILANERGIKIYALGACDLYRTISFLDMPNQNLTYECNYFNGKERAVNVGTEYIRSSFDMDDEDKLFCKEHFYNYTGETVFKPQIFEDNDFVILSFHDDMVYSIYRSKTKKSLRVVRSGDYRFGETSVIKDGESLTLTEQEKWLDENFYEGEFISPERFCENIMWIRSKLSPSTVLILITGPELDFYRKMYPHVPEVREQIIKLNKIIFELGEKSPELFSVLDINKFVRDRFDVTDYVFHLTPISSYEMFKALSEIMIDRSQNKKMILSEVIKGRAITIVGEGILAEKAALNLKIGGEYVSEIIGWKDNSKIKTDNDYVVIADERYEKDWRKLLLDLGRSERTDFCIYSTYSRWDTIMSNNNCKTEGDPFKWVIDNGCYVSDRQKWAKQSWDDFNESILKDDIKIVAFCIGAGLNYLTKRYPEIAKRIDSIVDNDIQKIGHLVGEFVSLQNGCESLMEKKIRSVDELKDELSDNVAIIIMSYRYYDDIASQLENMGICNFYSLVQLEARKLGVLE